MLNRLFYLILLLALGIELQAQPLQAKLNVVGLTCSACSFGTERSIRQLKFVEDVKMDLNTNIALVTFKKGVPVSIDQLVQKVYDAGFSVAKVLVTYKFTDEKLEGKIWKYNGDTYSILNESVPALSGEKELTFVSEKYLSKKEYKVWKPVLAPVQALYKEGTGSGRIYFVLF